MVVLVARMTRWDVGGRRSHPFVYFSASRWAATTGRSASVVYKRVATSFRTPLIPRWSSGAGLGGLERLTSVQRWNQTRALVRAKGEWGRDDTRLFNGNSLEEGQDLIAENCNEVLAFLQAVAVE